MPSMFTKKGQPTKKGQDQDQYIDIRTVYGDKQEDGHEFSGENAIYGNSTSRKSVKSKNKTSGPKKQQQDILLSEDEIYRNPTQKTSGSKQKLKKKKSSGLQQQQNQEVLFSEDVIYRNPTISEKPVTNNLYSSVLIVLAVIGIPATIIGLMVTGRPHK